MKLKGITIFERHAEKLVLGVFVLLILVVLLFQFGILGGSRSVPVGRAEQRLDRALAAVRDAALQRKARLESDQLAAGVPASLPDPLEVFETALASSSVSTDPLAVLGPPGVVGEASDSSSASIASLPKGDATFPEIKVPAPARPVAAVFEGTIDPLAAASIGPALSQLLPPQQPFDLRVPSVESVFDAAAFRRALAEPADSSITPLPPAFWRGAMEIVDVEWVRQTRAADGSWSAEEVLSALPGRRSLRELAQKSQPEPVDLRQLIEQERTARADIRRPLFYPTISGKPWAPPHRALEESALLSSGKVGELKVKIRRTRDEIEELKRRLERSGTGGERRPPPPPGRDNPPGNPPPPPQDRGPDRSPRSDADDLRRDLPGQSWFPKHYYAQSDRGNERRPPTPPPDQAQRSREVENRRRIEAQIEELAKLEKTLLEELRALGVDEAGAGPKPPPAAEPFVALAEPEPAQISLWTHDLTARSGQTYRYRARLWLTNPFFGQTDKLKPEQKAFAQAMTLTGDWSPWSEPVTIDPPVIYFVSSASEAGGALGSAARASAELYEFFYGYWRRASATLLPGDEFSAQAELPELTTFVIEGAGSTASVKDKVALDRTRRISAGVVLIDTALALVGSTSNPIQTYVSGPSGSVQVIPITPSDPGSQRARLAASAELGSTSKPDDLGSPDRRRMPGDPSNPPPDRPAPPPAPERDDERR